MESVKVLVAIDNSRSSQEAVACLSERLWYEGTEFLVVHVLEPVSTEYATMYMTYSSTYSRAVAERLCDAEKLAKNSADFIKKKVPHARVKSLLLEGPVKDCLIEKAREWQADFIIMGSQGRTGLSKLLLGSVAEMVLASSPCSVEVIRANRMAHP